MQVTKIWCEGAVFYAGPAVVGRARRCTGCVSHSRYRCCRCVFKLSMVSFMGANLHAGENPPVLGRVQLPINVRSNPVLVNGSRSSTPATVGNYQAETSETVEPRLVHKWSHTHSILCVLPYAKQELLFCGTQDAKILVFDLQTYTLKTVISTERHDDAASVLCLAMAENEQFLFAAGSDSLVRVYDISKAEFPCTHVIYSSVDIGDVFSLAYSSSLGTLFLGAQNASILWCDLSPNSASSGSEIKYERLPHVRYDRFFDSKGPGGSSNTPAQTKKTHSCLDLVRLVETKPDDIVRFAHNGFIYVMEVFDCHLPTAPHFVNNYASTYQSVLLSGGGDGSIKLWGISCSPRITLTELQTLENTASILAMTIQESYVYVGLSNSCVNVWDLVTNQLVRSFHFCLNNELTSDFQEQYPGQCDEILSLLLHNDCIFKASTKSGLVKFTLRSNPVPANLPKDVSNDSIVMSHEDDLYNSAFNTSSTSVLAMGKFSNSSGSSFLVSAGHQGLCLWDITNAGLNPKNENKVRPTKYNHGYTNDDLLTSLEGFISFKTILKNPTLYLEESRACAQFLSKLLVNLGALENKLIPVANGNPIVYSCFRANAPLVSTKKVPRVLWYAHYDVVEASSSDDWSTNPFILTAKDGNLYARGVSDNKGPALAAIYAVSELFQTKQLTCDIVFVLEGEEETGSVGFQRAITENKSFIGDVDWIMLSNSYWMDDEIPCLNYGLRGLINASLSVSSSKPDRHSGVDGGVLREPTMDLVQLLGQLRGPRNKINIDNFYDDCLPLMELEIKTYERIERIAAEKDIPNLDVPSLIAKWREPSLTIHKIEVSGPNNNTVIPQTAKASISLRIVPNQNLETIKKQLVSSLETAFKDLETDNKLKIDIFHEAEPWLGDPTNVAYKLLYKKIKENWGPNVPDPLFIREGGSIPSIRFLEKSFSAPAVQVPCGQASDNAHLKNEKLRILNLYKLRAILFDTFKELGDSHSISI